MAWLCGSCSERSPADRCTTPITNQSTTNWCHHTEHTTLHTLKTSLLSARKFTHEYKEIAVYQVSSCRRCLDHQFQCICERPRALEMLSQTHWAKHLSRERHNRPDAPSAVHCACKRACLGTRFNTECHLTVSYLYQRTECILYFMAALSVL